MSPKLLLTFFNTIETQRASLLEVLSQTPERTGALSARKKNYLNNFKKHAQVIFEVFFPPQCDLSRKGWNESARRRQILNIQKITDTSLGFEVLWDIMREVRSLIHGHIEIRSLIHGHVENEAAKSQRVTLHEAWETLWLQGVAEAVKAYLQKRDKALREKSMESSILFHTLQSLSAEPDLDTLLHKVVAQAAALMHAKQVYLFWAEEFVNGTVKQHRLQLKATNHSGTAYGEYLIGFGDGPIGKAAETRQPLIVDDYQGVSEKIPFLSDVDQMLIVPIVYSEDVLGVLVTADTRKRRRFVASDQELLMIFMNQIAAMLKTVILYQRQADIAAVMEEKNRILESQADVILRKKAQLEVMNEVGQQINSSLDLPEVLSLLTRHAAESIGVNRSVVWLMNEKKTGLDAVAAYGFPQGLLSQVSLFLPDMRKTRFFQALFERHAVEISEGQDTEFFQKKLQALTNIQSLLVVPLLLKQHAVGLLSVDDTREKHEFLEDEVTLVSAVANQAILAIENARLHQQVKEQAITDVMTGLFNHRYFQLRFTEEFSNSKRYGNALSVIMMDIDHFKHYNDTYGHIAGDLALKEIAQLTKVSMRENDILARYGGEEFVIILPMTNLEGAQVVAERIRSGVQECKFLGDFNLPQVSITVSLGVSTYSASHNKSEILLREADTALYQAKEGGRNRVVIYNPGMPEESQV
jgi:diguanylate cyclase (GGDEF)-like protein